MKNIFYRGRDIIDAVWAQAFSRASLARGGDGRRSGWGNDAWSAWQDWNSDSRGGALARVAMARTGRTGGGRRGALTN